MTQIVTSNTKITTVRELLKKQEGEIAKGLPKHLTADRMCRIALTSFQQIPKLLDCDPMSLVQSVMYCSQLGLEPDGALGYVYLIPYGNQVKTIIGYKGLLELAYRTGKFERIFARAVYEKDKFSYSFGLDETCVHQPSVVGKHGELTHAYAIARFNSGYAHFDVMAREDIEHVRGSSQTGQRGPWVEHYSEMSKKTVLRRLNKTLPLSVEVARAIGNDERVEAGLEPILDADVELPQIEDQAPKGKLNQLVAVSQKTGKRSANGDLVDLDGPAERQPGEDGQ